METSWKPGLRTSFQLVRLVGCGLKRTNKKNIMLVKIAVFLNTLTNANRVRFAAEAKKPLKRIQSKTSAPCTRKNLSDNPSPIFCNHAILYMENYQCAMQHQKVALWSIFIRLAVVGCQICEIPRNSDRIQTYSSSRSSKIIDYGVNRKCTCAFLLVINSNFGHISYRFRRRIF